MSSNKLFRKKSIESILKDVEKTKQNRTGKLLGVRDLTVFGIAAIIGAGIFTTIGKASADGGPSVILLFTFTALACSFAAFAYAEFASMVPASGSAYTYSYVAFGELIAWIIGWSLIMEYAIGNITVAISWSDYFTGLLSSGGVELPQWIQMDYLSAANGFEKATSLINSGEVLIDLEPALQSSYQAWTTSPSFAGIHFIADIPALLIIILITMLVYRGIKESKNAANLMVVIKLLIILLVIAVGIFYVDTNNWDPFAPNGIGGMLKGVSAVFFAYIGFDAISTTAEECENPQRDIPKSMMWSIIICTVLYISIALVITGMVNYSHLNVGDPLAYVFKELNLKWMSGIIAVSALVAMAGVLLVFQIGQPRIWMSMSRDGLLPKSFSNIHPKFNTPSFSTIVTGFVVAIPALFMNLTMVTDLCSIGTLFAFVVVCAGVLHLQNNKDAPKGSFKTPYINSKFIIPILLIGSIFYSFNYNKESTIAFINNTKQVNGATAIITSLNNEELEKVKGALTVGNNNIEEYLSNLDDTDYINTLSMLPISEDLKFKSGFHLFKEKTPMWIFIFTCFGLAIWSYRKNLSLIPMLGLISCFYMMAELGLSNWIGFGIWLLIGIVIYFSYSRKKSNLNGIVTESYKKG